jgi:hypothetical protein
MARILAYTSPARGHLYPLTPILDELARRGHDICVRTLASEVALKTVVMVGPCAWEPPEPAGSQRDSPPPEARPPRPPRSKSAYRIIAGRCSCLARTRLLY